MSLRKKNRGVSPADVRRGAAQEARAENLLQEATATRKEQQQLRNQENHGVVSRLEQLARENNLTDWMFDVISGWGAGG